MRLNLARTIARSAANGPGERFTIWVQGCPLACPGCWNPDTWAFERRALRSIESLLADIRATVGIEGVTLTGGEPFAQARSLAELARSVRADGLSVFVFTGYDLSELDRPEHRDLLAQTDVLVAGRYREALPAQDQSWLGSSNQRVHFLSERYCADDMREAPEAEVWIDAAWRIVVTGFP